MGIAEATLHIRKRRYRSLGVAEIQEMRRPAHGMRPPYACASVNWHTRVTDSDTSGRGRYTDAKPEGRQVADPPYRLEGLRVRMRQRRKERLILDRGAVPLATRRTQ
jgi:hypothetical protein